MIFSHVLHIPKNKAHGRKVFSTDGTGRLTLLIQTKNTYMYASMLGLMKFMAESESESLDSEKIVYLHACPATEHTNRAKKYSCI